MICDISNNIKAAELLGNNINLSLMLCTNYMYHDSLPDYTCGLNYDLLWRLYEIISTLEVRSICFFIERMIKALV